MGAVSDMGMSLPPRIRIRSMIPGRASWIAASKNAMYFSEI